jgi:ABC-type transport system substrate-binding protein
MINTRGKRFPSSRLILLLVIVAWSAGLAAPVPTGPQAQAKFPRAGGTFRVKGHYLPFNQVFDPARPSHYFITEQLYDGLVRFDNRFNPTPALAEYWTISEDGTRITFHLRDGVRFHNGHELTAEDVKYSLERLVEDRPDNTVYRHFIGKVVGAEAYWQGRAADVEGFRVVDQKTFEIQWLRPYVSGLYLLGMYYCKILPKDLLESQGRNFFHKPIGTGPFKFAEWLRSPRLEILGVRLERNADHYAGPPYLAALEYSPHFTEEQFEAGSIHFMSVTSDRAIRRKFPILENSTLKTYFLAFSCDMPPLDRPEIRKALALGLDKVRLAEACDSPGTVHQVENNHIPPYLPGFFPKTAGPFTDPDTAKLLLDRFLPEGGRKALKLTLLLDPPKTDEKADFARELERQLEALEIELDVRYLRRPEDALTVRTPYVKFLIYTMDFPDPENIIGPLYRSGAAVNALNSRYVQPRLDELLRQSEVEASWERRTALFREIEKLLDKEIPAVPLFLERILMAIQPQVRGARLPAMGFIFMDVKSIWLDSEKAR